MSKYARVANRILEFIEAAESIQWTNVDFRFWQDADLSVEEWAAAILEAEFPGEES